jgi:predicted AlkP superfamily phosphohydrolase/phosphomutase
MWRFRGSSHPLAEGVERVYEAMDRATGTLLERWPEADFLVVSDHGAGPLHADVNLSAWLVERDQAVYRGRRASPLLRLAWALPPRVRKLGRRFAPEAARKTLGATVTGQLGPFDWSRTQAFCGINGDLWLNLSGREPRGMVTEKTATELEEELIAGLLELRDPSRDAPMVRAVHRRDEIYEGPASALAPDLIVDMWSEGYRMAPARGPSELVVAPQPLAGVKEAWSSEHRPLGIFVAGGRRIASGAAEELSLLDVCPSVLALLECPVPAGLDGRAAVEAFDAGWLSSHPVSSSEATTARSSEGDYSDEDAAAVAAHLKDLGYIE